MKKNRGVISTEWILYIWAKKFGRALYKIWVRKYNISTVGRVSENVVMGTAYYHSGEMCKFSMMPKTLVRWHHWWSRVPTPAPTFLFRASFNVTANLCPTFSRAKDSRVNKTKAQRGKIRKILRRFPSANILIIWAPLLLSTARCKAVAPPCGVFIETSASDFRIRRITSSWKSVINIDKCNADRPYKQRLK